MQDTSNRARGRDRDSRRQTYRIKYQLPSFIRQGRLVGTQVYEQVILELTRSTGHDDLPFDPNLDRYITIPAGNMIHKFDSDRYSGGKSGQAFYIPNVIDGRPGPQLPSTLLQATFYVVPEANNWTGACSVELRGYNGQGHARIKRLSDTELTIVN